MNFKNFQIVRHNTFKGSTYPKDIIPLWVASMDLPLLPKIQTALIHRVKRGDYTYEYVSDSLFSTLIQWCEDRFLWKIKKENVFFLPGVVYSINLFIKLLSNPSDNWITFTPVYPPFLKAGYPDIKITQVPFKTQNHLIDSILFEKSIHLQTKGVLISSPQNPTGKVYSKEELIPFMEICKKHNLWIITDEIWWDLVYDKRHIPLPKMFPEYSEKIIQLSAPSKTFNIPGLGVSFAILDNEKLKQNLSQMLHGIIPDINVLSKSVAESVWKDGISWLEETMDYLNDNKKMCLDFFEKETNIKIGPADATYLLWLDFAKTNIASPYRFLLEHAKCALSDGAPFGIGFEKFARLNYALPREILSVALNRIKKSLEK